MTTSSSLSCCLAVGPGLLDARLQPLGAVGDDAEVGEEHLVAEGGEVGRRVAAGEGAEDDQQGVPLADQGEALGVVAVRAGDQAGGVEHLDGGRGDLLRLVQRGQEVEPGVGQGGDPDLPGVDLARVGRRPGQELEQRALAAPGETDQSDSHGPAFLSSLDPVMSVGRRSRRAAITRPDGEGRVGDLGRASVTGESAWLTACVARRLASRASRRSPGCSGRRRARSRWPNRTR